MMWVYLHTVLNAAFVSFLLHLMLVASDLLSAIVSFFLLILFGSSFPGHIIQKISEVQGDV